MQRWKITIEYDGTHLHGWQRQADGVISVQECIETAIFKFCGQDIRITGAGRTDSGVHARAQIAHFDLDYGDRPLEPFELAKAINAHLRPQPIAIVRAEKVHDDFHARFNAKNKLYQYRVISRKSQPVMDINTAWHCHYELDMDAMKRAASDLVGHHDFTSFRDSNCQAKSPVRTLERIHITKRDYDRFGGVEYIFELEAMSFLHHQCRNIVGTLVQVGRHKINPTIMPDILAAKDRSAAGMTAPAKGLMLAHIDYQ